MLRPLIPVLLPKVGQPLPPLLREDMALHAPFRRIRRGRRSHMSAELRESSRLLHSQTDRSVTANQKKRRRVFALLQPTTEPLAKPRCRVSHLLRNVTPKRRVQASPGRAASPKQCGGEERGREEERERGEREGVREREGGRESWAEEPGAASDECEGNKPQGEQDGETSSASRSPCAEQEGVERERGEGAEAPSAIAVNRGREENEARNRRKRRPKEKKNRGGREEKYHRVKENDGKNHRGNGRTDGYGRRGHEAPPSCAMWTKYKRKRSCSCFGFGDW
eukprot:scaffold26867_cov28-Tisochrysis_lutea.AAC.1